MNWFKQQLANVAGTQEPIYGPSAIQTVTEQAQESPYTELDKNALRWFAKQYTCVETQTFYITTPNGHIGMAQIIYNNIAGLRTTCQFNTKLFNPDGTKIWTSDPLSGHGFDEEKFSFYADNCAVTLSDDGASYTIKSTVNEKNFVDLEFVRAAPGFVVGKDGTSYFGTDKENPWGSMHHAFWPRCNVKGRFVLEGVELRMDGLGLFIHALQGMKPHHAASRWNFANFQSPTYSAVLMEFTTPPSYGSTVVNVGGIAEDGRLIYAGAENRATHTGITGDSEVDWPEPNSVSFQWSGKQSGGSGQVKAELSGKLGTRLDRIDVMAEVPGFVKQIVANAAGTRPYIYQYGPSLSFEIDIDGKESSTDGTMFMEATFIS